MPSPFPGMDPYLESHWRDVHTRLMVYAADAIQEQLPVDLAAQVEESVSIDEEGGEPRTVVPDVSVTEQPVSSVWQKPSGDFPTAIAEPLIVAAEQVERHIEIVDSTSDDRVVTVIEFLSPSNKLPGSDRTRYLAKQQAYMNSGANLVEIDLVRAGDFVVAVSSGNLSSEYLEPYIVCVRRTSRRADAEVYRMPLRNRLSAIRIPLRDVDEDVVLDLQALIAACYERGRYSAKIDYAADPQPPLGPADAEWAEELLRGSGLRL